MKTQKTLCMLLIALLIAGLGAACSSPTATPLSGVSSVAALSSGQSEAQPRVVTVTGSGTAMGTPDIAYVQLGVEIKDTSPSEAAAANADKMNAVVSAIKALGVADKDIRTANYNIWIEQVYDKEGQPTGVVYYHVVNNVVVTVRDIHKVGELLEKAVVAGVNQVGGVSFSVSDPTALQREARDKAMADAKARAAQLAEGLGFKLGRVQSVSEYASEAPTPVPARAAYEYVSVAAPPISGGELTITVQVSVSFEIE